MIFLDSPIFWIAALVLAILLGNALRKTFGSLSRQIDRDVEYLRQLPRNDTACASYLEETGRTISDEYLPAYEAELRLKRGSQ